MNRRNFLATAIVVPFLPLTGRKSYDDYIDELADKVVLEVQDLMPDVDFYAYPFDMVYMETLVQVKIDRTNKTKAPNYLLGKDVYWIRFSRRERTRQDFYDFGVKCDWKRQDVEAVVRNIACRFICEYRYL
jgi:hypothetical protein